MRTRSSRRWHHLFLALLVALLCISAPPALADDPGNADKALVDCSKEENPKKACFDLFRQECKAGEDKVKDTPGCKAFAEKSLLKKDKSSLGEKVCKGNDATYCEAVRKGSEVTRKVDDATTHPAETLASAAFDAVSGKFGDAATKILNDLTDVFTKVAIVDLHNDGLLTVYEMTWGLSSVVALLLLIWQFAKVAATGQAVSAATAVIGLAKWALVSMASFAVTQTSVGAAHEVSVWLIDAYKGGAGEKAFKESLNSAFAFTGLANTALVLLLAIVAALVSLVLWGELLLRQAAIQVLVACMPIVGAGGIMEATKEWWPKARNALIALILIEPVIVLILVIGFSVTGSGKDLKSVLVGLVTLLLAAVAWPTLAKFMTFTTVGSGGALAGGLLGAAGGTAASMFAYGGGMPSGAGAVGGGRAFTRAVEAENDGAVAQDGAAGRARGTGGGGGGGLAGGLGKLGAAAMALQVAKAGKELAEGSMESMAAHADLGHGKDMGGQVSIPPRYGTGSGPGEGFDGASPPPPAPSGGPDAPPDIGTVPAPVSAGAAEPPPAAAPAGTGGSAGWGEERADEGLVSEIDLRWPSSPAEPPPVTRGGGEENGGTQ
ncbi:hypothetical protein ACFP1Z_32455 [Streptomyces gamaensis]|uniref:Type IV secretion system protein n=1 Tax=Streptomyces gamaensis TaxID=1763542 RepID=A0ABW0ZE71_9ACTN